MGCATFTKFTDENGVVHLGPLGFQPGDKAFCRKWSRPDRSVDECNGGLIDQNSRICKRCSGIANEMRRGG